MNLIFGYTCVSSKTQNLEKQIEELEKFGCNRIYREKKQGHNFDRPVYKEMRSEMQFGDVLVVHDLNKFGRNKKEIRDEWKDLTDDKIDISVLHMPILDTRKYKEFKKEDQLVSNLVLTLLSWMVEEEKERIKEAQREGIEIAKKQGKFLGGKKRYHNEAEGRDKIIYDEVVKCLINYVSVMDIHRKTGLSRNTIYSIKKELEIKNTL